MQFHFQSQAAW